MSTTALVTNVPRFGRRGSAAAALVIYTALAVAMLSSTWVHPATWSVGVPGDAQEFVWFLSWPPFAVTHGDNPLFTNYIDYPGGVNLMWNGSVLLPAVLLGPLTNLGGSILAYNVLVTAALALSAWTAFLLIRRFVSSHLAAAAGGLLYGFSPFMTAHSLGHAHLTLAFIPPLLLLLLDEIVRVQRRRALVSGLLLGLAAAAQLFIGEEVLAMTAVICFLLICVAVGLRKDLVRLHLNHAVRALAIAAAVFGALSVFPVAFQFAGPQHLRGAVHAPNTYISDALSFFVPTKLELAAPSPATAISDRFLGGPVEANSYVGIVLALLLAFIAVRYWSRLEVRLATLGSVLIAILSMGITIHFAGRASSLPVFTLGLVFPLLQRYLPGRLMLFLTFFGWLGLARLPVLANILPGRLMLFFYLLAGLLIAVWLDDLKGWQPQSRKLGWVAMAVALVLLLPALPYPSTPESVPAFFTGTSVSRIPAGSVALVIPYSAAGDARAMVWQAQAGLRFRIPEGYAFVPDAPPRGWRLSPPPSATQDQTLAIADGTASTLTDETRQQMLAELKSWNVQTVIVGPMTNEQQEVDLFTTLLGGPPQLVDGVNVWWDVHV
jgi:hypothetical protein